MEKKFKSFSNNQLDSNHLHVFRNLFLLVNEQNSIKTVIINKHCLQRRLQSLSNFLTIMLISKYLDSYRRRPRRTIAIQHFLRQPSSIQTTV